jgi:hypothetical protein
MGILYFYRFSEEKITMYWSILLIAGRVSILYRDQVIDPSNTSMSRGLIILNYPYYLYEMQQVQ